MSMVLEGGLPADSVTLPGRVVSAGIDYRQGQVRIRAGQISAVHSVMDPVRRGVPSWWESGWTIVPGFVDLHNHGGAGVEFGADSEAAIAAAAHHLHNGTTHVVASLVSATGTSMAQSIRALAPLVDAGILAGIHLEGPFLSHQCRGAQDPRVLIDVDPALIESWVVAAAEGGAPDAIVQMTFAPERAGSPVLPALLQRHNIVGAIGHTAASFDMVEAMLQALLERSVRGGRPLVTHVFNGMRQLHHRDPGPVAGALAAAANGHAVLEVIADGVHLEPETLRMLFALAGPENLALVSDAMAASGMPPGRYTLGGRDVDVTSRAAHLVEGNSLAGGLATSVDLIRTCVVDAGVSLVNAVTAATRTPATVLGFVDRGELRTGHRADLVVLDNALNIVAVMKGGTWVRTPLDEGLPRKNSRTQTAGAIA